MYSMSFFGGLLFIIGGLVLLPPTFKIIEDKIGRQLTRPTKYFTAFGAVFIGIVFVANNQVDKESEIKKQDFSWRASYILLLLDFVTKFQYLLTLKLIIILSYKISKMSVKLHLMF